MADAAECICGGSIAGAVIGTFFATLVLGAFLLFLWNLYRKRRARSSPLHDLVMVEDGDRREEQPKRNFSYDNPGFFDDSTDPKKHHSQQSYGIRQNGTGKQVSNQEGKGKHLPWGPLTFLFNRNARNAVDDSALEEPQVYTASLKGHDFTGLGFNICGNMRDGIFIKDIMQRGPAAESKRILPGDRITALTISFRHMVLDDALTLLSYASPYDVSLDMLRLPEKSLSHKGIHLLSGSSHLSGQGSSSPTTDMVCHPFFKSQSIDDLRKVGKEHLSFKDDGMRTSTSKRENGIKSQSPLVVVPKDSRPSKSPSGKQFKQKAGSSPKQPKRDEAVITMPDETDKGPETVQQMNVKPELVPRAKSKTITVKSEAMPPPGIVEAISPVVKMAYEEPSKTPTPPIIKPTRNSVKITCAEIPDPILQHMAGFGSTPDGAPLASVTPSDVSITIEQEQMNTPPIQKPKRQKKSLLNVLKEKAASHESEKKPKAEGEDVPPPSSDEPQEKDKEQHKSRLGKFGIRVLPDISLNFGKKTPTPTPEREDDENGRVSASPNKEKRKKEKSKDKDKSVEPQPKQEIIDDVELDLSLAVPKGGDSVVEESTSERPPSTDSLDSAEKPTSRKSSGFHLPSIGIKLPKFGHSKQYNLEPEDDGHGHSHSEHSSPTKAERQSNISSNVIVKKLDDSNEMNMSTASVVSQAIPSADADTPDRSAIERVKSVEKTEEGKEKQPGLMSKGLQSLRDFKDKVTHKLSSSHDSISSSSSEDEEDKDKAAGAVDDEVRRAKKEKREARAAAKLRAKQEKEERAKEKAREKERLKAEKLARKAELKRKSSKQDQSSELSSSEESDAGESQQPKKKAKSKGKKAEEVIDDKNETRMATSSKESDDVEKIESAEMIQEVAKGSSQMQSIKSKLVPAKPPVAPRQSKDSSKKDADAEKEADEGKPDNKPKRSRRDCASSSKSSSSSNSSSDGSDSEGKVNKLTKRQAPTPPVPTGAATEGAKGNIVVTKAEVTEAPRDSHQHQHSGPEIVEATVKPKSKIPVKIHGVNSGPRSRSTTPDKRSASFADLSSLQSTPKSKVDSLERAVSMDMGTEEDAGNNARGAHIPNMVMSPVEDLSTATDSTMTAVTHAHYKHSQQSFSSSGSSSSETLKASPNSVQVFQCEESTSSEMARTSIEVHKMVQDTVTLISTGVHLKEEGRVSSYSPNHVTIATVAEDPEVRDVATDAVDEILAKLNAQPPDAPEDAPPQENKMSIDVMDRTTNVTIMNVRNVSESSTKALDIQIDDPSKSGSSKSDKSDSSKQLLRGDSKSRLMQLVADANEIKITQKSPPRKDSGSPQVSPEIQSDNRPPFPETKAPTTQANGANKPVNGQTIEITATELDGIMMSHSEFLARQGQAVLHPIETLPKDSSFDNWVYVDQKYSTSTSPTENTEAQGDGHRNGALSPPSYKTAIEFETSELKVTTSSPTPTHADPTTKPSISKVYSTTMTLPQKTITQITLGPESSHNIEITSPLPTFK